MKIEFRESEYRKPIESYVRLTDWEMDARIMTDEGPVEAFEDGYFPTWIWVFFISCVGGLPEILAGEEVRVEPDADASWEMVFRPSDHQIEIFIDTGVRGGSHPGVTVTRSEFAEGVFDGTERFLEYIQDARPEWGDRSDYEHLETVLQQRKEWYNSIYTQDEIP